MRKIVRIIKYNFFTYRVTNCISLELIPTKVPQQKCTPNGQHGVDVLTVTKEE